MLIRENGREISSKVHLKKINNVYRVNVRTIKRIMILLTIIMLYALVLCRLTNVFSWPLKIIRVYGTYTCIGYGYIPSSLFVYACTYVLYSLLVGIRPRLRVFSRLHYSNWPSVKKLVPFSRPLRPSRESVREGRCPEGLITSFYINYRAFIVNVLRCR